MLEARDLANHEAGTAELGARSPMGFGDILSCLGKACKAPVEEAKVPWDYLDPADQAPWMSKAERVIKKRPGDGHLLHMHQKNGLKWITRRTGLRTTALTWI